MWPWSEQPHIATLLERRSLLPRDEASSSGSGRRSAEGVAADGAREGAAEGGAPAALRPLVLLAPGGGGDMEPPPPGSYAAPADFPVDGALLEAAASDVRWLVITFPRRDTKFPFPPWVLRLRNLRGLSLESYPHPTLPEAIGDLAALERLHCYRSGLRRVPRSVGKLANLEELDLYTSYDLHYLPFEVTRCPNLRRSRFSTRALYANFKNDLALPVLRPWWHDASDRDAVGAPTYEAVRDLLLRRLDFGRADAPSEHHGWSEQNAASATRPDRPLFLPANVIDHCILPYLPWNLCSVCRVRYAHDLGRHAWSRRTVATDRQALLAFCCSSLCASRVRDQVRHDPRRGVNVTFGPQSRAGGGGPIMTEEEARTAWEGGFSANAEEGVSSPFFRRDHSVPPPHKAWAEEHLRPWPAEAAPPGMGAREIFGGETIEGARRMRVIASGDVRERPSSSSQRIGRLGIGESVQVIAHHTDVGGREWAQLSQFGSQKGSCWTAVAKKDGTVKLIGIPEQGSSATAGHGARARQGGAPDVSLDIAHTAERELMELMEDEDLNILLQLAASAPGKG